uniref:Uncharacterized protein AlNc14C2G359 n=1 Tax=Albugo laibachii Nc14 TaxID=890382 RepID=F0VZM1_9STRA|nr:conserved hypothetical protein [Albugo laibachii Nc14]|eukprot:CCA14251.1 conserved hypothetical protein [Albugo laibachii Nc14]
MHSFDNGIGFKVKKDNWDQLTKLFQRVPELESAMTKTDIDEVIYCHNGAAVAMMNKLYECLTKRVIMKNTAQPPASEDSSTNQLTSEVQVNATPSYAKTTGITIIRQRAREAEVSEIKDEMEISRMLRETQLQHEALVKLERPRRELGADAMNAEKINQHHGMKAPVRKYHDKTISKASDVIKEVQIRSVSIPNLDHLHTARETRDADTRIDTVLHHGSENVMVINEDFNKSSQDTSAMKLLDTFVSQHPSSCGSTLDETGQFSAFLCSLQNKSHDRDGACSLLSDLACDQSKDLAHLFLESPQDFWLFFGLMHPFLVGSTCNKRIDENLKKLIISIGQQCVNRDSSRATILAMDYIIPKLPNVESLTSRRMTFVEILYAFTARSPIGHIQMLKRIRESTSIENLQVFIHMLSISIHMESELDDALVDLYYYYCCIGLEKSSVKLRAACLGMLSPLIQCNPSLGSNIFSFLSLSSLSAHNWWEVKVQMLRVSSTMLRLLVDSGNMCKNDFEAPLATIDQEFRPESHLIVRQMGLYYFASILKSLQELVPIYVDVLLSLPEALISALFGSPRDDHHARNAIWESNNAHDAEGNRFQLVSVGYSGIQYSTGPLQPLWDSIAVAKQLFYQWQMNTAIPGNDKATITYSCMIILHACFSQLFAHEATITSAIELYEQLKSSIVLGLLQIRLLHFAIEIMEMVFEHCDGSLDFLIENMLTDDQFIMVATELISHGNQDIRQIALEDLLLAKMQNPRIKSLILDCVRAIESHSQSAEFRASRYYHDILR